MPSLMRGSGAMLCSSSDVRRSTSARSRRRKWYGAVSGSAAAAAAGPNPPVTDRRCEAVAVDLVPPTLRNEQRVAGLGNDAITHRLSGKQSR